MPPPPIPMLEAWWFFCFLVFFLCFVFCLAVFMYLKKEINSKGHVVEYFWHNGW